MTKSFEKETCVILDDGVTEQCTIQCVPRDSLCTDGSPKVNNSCPPPQDPDCPQGLIPPDFSPFTADQCVQPPSGGNMCEPVPTCGANEKHDVTGTKDSCGFEILVCVPKTTTPDGCPDGQIKNQDGMCVPEGEDVEPPINGGCRVGYTINIFGNCQRIGSGTMGNGGGGGGTDDQNFCALDSTFNFSQCLSQLIAGTGTLTAGGETR